MTAPLAGLIGIGSTVLGGLTSASGAEKMGKAQLQQNIYQYGTAVLNSQIAKQNADWAINQGEVQARDYGMAGAQRIANITTAQAASGIDVNSGSAKDVQVGQKQVINMDTDEIRSNAAKTAYNFDVQSMQFDRQGQLYLMAGSNAVQAAGINAESSIIGTAGSVASKWSQGSQSGLFNAPSAAFGAASSAYSDVTSNPFEGY
jgi:hypothetical protein